MCAACLAHAHIICGELRGLVEVKRVAFEHGVPNCYRRFEAQNQRPLPFPQCNEEDGRMIAMVSAPQATVSVASSGKSSLYEHTMRLVIST